MKKDDDNSLVKADGDFICISSQCHAPCAFEGIAENILERVCIAIPDLDCAQCTQ